MRTAHTFRFTSLGTAIAVCLALPAGLAMGLAAFPAQAQVMPGAVQQAEVDPPGRVARLDYFEGGVSHLPAGSQDWNPASVNYPLGAGDRIATDAGARAEMHLGSTVLRLAPQTQVDITTLDDEKAYITLNEGTAVLRVRSLFPGQHLEVNTANLAFSITQPGEYRVDIEPGTGITRVTVPSGGGVVYGEAGQTQLLRAPQQVRFGGRNLAQVSAQNGAPRDGFDQWAAARDRLEDQSVSAQYVSRELVGYQQLDQYGDWSTVSGVGPVWYPRTVAAGWQPYRYGHWRNVAPWGWTWVDDAPWGFAPSHYGRWTQVGPRWGWVPGPLQPRPVYAPALVAFVGGNSGGVNWSISVGGGQPGVAWFPLAPGEAYRPAFRASPRYVTRINQTVVVNNVTNVTNVYRFQRPDFVTAQRADAFARGRPTREDFHRVAQADLSRARVVDRPDIQPERRDPPRADNRGPDRTPDRISDRTPDRDGRDGRPGFAGNVGAMPNGGLGNPPNPLNAEAAQREQLRRLQAEDQRQRSMNTMQERQQAQSREDAQRRALAEQQQRQMQQGSTFTRPGEAGSLQQQLEERGQREQREQQQQRMQQERQQRDQRDRQDRSQNEQRQMQERQAQAREQQMQQHQQQAAQQAQRVQQEQAARQAQAQAQEQQRAQQQASQQAQQAQQAQRTAQQAQREQEQRNQSAPQGRPDRTAGPDEPRRPLRPDRQPG